MKKVLTTLTVISMMMFPLAGFAQTSPVNVSAPLTKAVAKANKQVNQKIHTASRAQNRVNTKLVKVNNHVTKAKTETLAKKTAVQQILKK